MKYSWENEIAGFFKGEGYMGIQSYTKKLKLIDGSIKRSKKLYRPQMQISLRLDDIDALKFIKEKLGGYLMERLKPSNEKSFPVAVWGTNSTEVIRMVCDILLESKMPSLKKEQAKFMKEFLKLRLEKDSKIKYSSGRRYTEKELIKMEELKQKLHSLKRYSL